VDDPKDIPTVNLNFLVKWGTYSHLHDTWESYDFLKRFKGLKRVDNYIKAVWKPQNVVLTNKNTSREDLETMQIERERRKEVVESFKDVERIIAQKNAPANKDVPYGHLSYYCKWRGLPYSDCTWEVSSLLLLRRFDRISTGTKRKSARAL